MVRYIGSPEIESAENALQVRTMRNVLGGIAVAAIVTLASFPTGAHAADLAKGKALFAERCASCHGPLGAGDGPVAQGLPADLKPRNLQDGKFKVAVDDEKLRKLFKEGGAALGLNPLMTGAPGLTDADYDSLIAFVHSLKK